MAGIPFNKSTCFSRDRFGCSIVRHKCRQALDHLLCFKNMPPRGADKGSTSTTQLQVNIKCSCTGSPPNAIHGAARDHSDQFQKKPLRFFQVLLPAGVEGSNSSAVQNTVICSPADSHHRCLHYVTICSAREVYNTMPEQAFQSCSGAFTEHADEAVAACFAGAMPVSDLLHTGTFTA